MESTEKKNSYKPNHKKHGSNNRRQKSDNGRDNGQFKKHKQFRDKQNEEKAAFTSPAPQEKSDNKKKPAEKKSKKLTKQSHTMKTKNYSEKKFSLFKIFVKISTIISIVLVLTIYLLSIS